MTSLDRTAISQTRIPTLTEPRRSLPAIGFGDVPSRLTRRTAISATASLCGLSLPAYLGIRHAAANEGSTTGGKAKSCIIIYLWGGMSHLESFDLKPNAPAKIRGEFKPISTIIPGIEISEHLPLLAMQTDKLAIVRSIHHDDAAHGRGMYWNLTGHKPPRAGNIPPMQEDWPSLLAMVSQFRASPQGVPGSVRIPYPMVDNNTLQAGEYGGWLGVQSDPIVMRPAAGVPFEGVSRTLGSDVLDLKDVDVVRLQARRSLLSSLEDPARQTREQGNFQHFHDLAEDILSGAAIKQAYDLDREPAAVREMYGKHLGGTSLLLARRLTEAGVPIVQVCCAAGDLNGGAGDMWDTHGDNFNRMKKKLLPVFDQGAAALLQDLANRGSLAETLVVVLTDFGRTPNINGGAGRDHYPDAYSIALAGGGIQGGQVYGSSDQHGAYPKSLACTPPDVHATIFHALGISPRSQLRDMLNRPRDICDGEILPLFS